MMNIITQIAIFLCYFILLAYIIINTKRYKKVKEELERIRLEQEKINFWIFVTDKKQKMLQGKKIS